MKKEERIEQFLDIYSDGGEWEDFEGPLNGILDELNAAKADSASLREALEGIIKLCELGHHLNTIKDAARRALNK